jgi:hypothetical protein
LWSLYMASALTYSSLAFSWRRPKASNSARKLSHSLVKSVRTLSSHCTSESSEEVSYIDFSIKHHYRVIISIFFNLP